MYETKIIKHIIRISYMVRCYITCSIRQYSYKSIMEIIINIFAVIGVFATVLALYHFGVDQYALWEMRMKEKYGK